MMTKSKPRNSWLPILLVIAAIAIWGVNQLNLPVKKDSLNRTSTQRSPPKNAPPSAPSKTRTTDKMGNYEVYRNCTLVEARNNDGDSFVINLPNGEKSEFRLYFVDTPESAFKSYPGGQNNHQRIRQQAADLGGITPEQAVEIGKKGKNFTLNLLASKPFTTFTKWDSPFHDNRHHAFIEVQENGKPRWLEELLVERGLVRIHTTPADLPDGTPAAEQKQRLKELERAARRAEVGVWGL